MTRFSGPTFAAAAVLGATSALADGHAGPQPDTGVYGFVFGGVTFNGALDTNGTIGGGPQTVDTDYDSGFQLGFGIGRSFPSLSSETIGVRGEIELSYGEADADEIRFSGNGSAAEVNVGGGITSTTLFANVYADFASTGAVTPFVGAGVGVGRFSQDLIYGPGVQVNESDTAFGAQLIAGVAWDVADKVTLTADARYRQFFDIESGRFAPTGASTGLVSGDLSDVSLNIGARIAF